MRVRGLYADEALGRFAPEQHVNVWDVWLESFFCEAKMNCLPNEVLDDPEDYFLEPTDETGRPVDPRLVTTTNDKTEQANGIKL
jgi:hypothetical protein